MTLPEIIILRKQFARMKHQAKLRLERIRDLEERVRILEQEHDKKNKGSMG